MSKLHKILLLPMCGLGDAVCYIPALDALRSRFPSAEIVAIVATGPAAAILKNSSANIEVIVFNRGGAQRGWRSLLTLLRSLRRRGFDVVISGAHPDSVRVPAFAFLCGAKARVGAMSERLSFLYSVRVDVPTEAHYFERYRALLTGVGITMAPEEYRPILKPPLEAKESAVQIWHEAGLREGDFVVGLASGADVNSRGQWSPYMKRWNPTGYAEIAKWITNKLPARVVIFGGPEEAKLADVIATISGVTIVNLCGKTGIPELQWLIAKCSLFITNDTGIMHMAGALGVKVVALFGPTSPDSFRPPGERHHIVQGRAPCAPCYPHPTCGLKQCRAMDDIAPRQVVDAISAFLDSKEEAQVLQD